MRSRSLRRTLLPLLAALVLAACHNKDEATQVGGSTPEAAVQGSIDLLKAGDFNGLWKHVLPAADYATLRTDWSRHNANRPPVSATDKARFNAAVQKLTGPDAETKLYAEVRPKLDQMQQQYKDQLPVLVAMGGAFLKNNVAQNQTLDSEQKAQADSLVDVLTPWAQQAPWFDQARAKQAVGVLVATARKLDLKSPEQLRSMDFDTAMTQYASGYAGLKQALAIYGLSVDDALASTRLSTVSNQNGRAVVKIDYTLLGKPLSAETTLVQQDGRWYSESLVDNVRKAHEQLQQPATTGSASAH
ncbi:hypothetical protein IHE49_05645 [Rhodanobacter sp. 7MK24]|uniref:hypothetical protein n=1 Tax=Rhodanobacter sp. 7MK24 TaxID=2775922 RepID=UPI001780232A|nr:hypothetical protein [Rhodanobacter sp. 7MK24]MBD8879957.1 hypothetical protein [Rhodanobacter sp. 7MK24]